MDFLALTPTGQPQPNAAFDIGGKTYVADSSAIVHRVAANHTHGLLNMGAVPLPPSGWKDPRLVIFVDGKQI
jgi:hypothetical protein